MRERIERHSLRRAARADSWVRRSASACVAKQRARVRRRQSFPDALRGIEWLTGDFADIQHVKEAIHGCDTVFTSPTPRRRPVPTRTRSPICNPTSPRRWDYWMRAVTWASSALSSFRRAARSTVCPSRYPRRNPHPPCRLPRMAFQIVDRKYLALYEYLHGIVSCTPGGQPLWSLPDGNQESRRHRRLHATLPGRRAASNLGDGSVVRDYIYADDVIDALIQAVKHEGTSRVFNVGAGHGRSLLDIIKPSSRYPDARLPWSSCPNATWMFHAVFWTRRSPRRS